MNHLRLSATLVVALSLCRFACAGIDTALWSDLAQGLPPPTAPDLKNSPAPADRLAYALSLLSRQPMTQGNIAEAERICGELAADKQPSKIPLIAGYLYARIAHVHRIPADLDAASARYETLWKNHPLEIPGQQSLVKQATIELYRDKPNFQKRFSAYAAAAPGFTSPEAKRDLHLVLADAAQRFGLPDATVLAHVQAALAAAPSQPALKADLLIRIAELARLTGHRAEAASHYQRFIDEFPRDGRRTLARERLNALGEASPQ